MNSLQKWLAASVLALVGLGCSGPSCESACQKSFSTCALTFLNPDSSIEEQISACTQACNESMRDPTREAEAIGWVGCVSDFNCDPDDEGVTLCLTCQSGYYLGQSSGTACSYPDNTTQ